MKNFEYALSKLKEGFKVSRKGWNGKGMFIFLFESGTIIKHPYPKDYELKDGDILGYDALPYIMMKTVDNNCVPWLASQTDLLAEDWEVVEDIIPSTEDIPTTEDE